MEFGYNCSLGIWFFAFFFLEIQKAIIRLLLHKPICCYCSFTPVSTLMLIFLEVVVCNWVASFSILFPFRVGNTHVDSWGLRDFPIAIRICQNFFSCAKNFKPLCSSPGRSISFFWIFEVGDLQNIQMNQHLLRFLKWFPNLISLYIAVLLIIFTESTSSNWGVKTIIEATQMETGGSSGLKEELERGKKRRTSKRTNTLTTTVSSLQLRRRSGRLANLYWKDLSGISSKAEPIILDSDLSDADEEDGKRVEDIGSEDKVGENINGTLERDFLAYSKTGKELQGHPKEAEEAGRRKAK